jgi:excisionase family DNA binding protein
MNTQLISSAARLYLSPPEAGERLGVAAEKVIAWIKAGELRATNVATRLGGRPRWRIHEADLEAFLAARSAVSASAPTRRTPRQKPVDVTAYF